jgi:hypothetical protein
MHIIVESVDRDSEAKVLFDNSSEYGMLVIILDDGTRFRVDQEDDYNGHPMLCLNMYAPGGHDIMRIVPAASNTIRIGKFEKQ